MKKTTKDTDKTLEEVMAEIEKNIVKCKQPF